MHMGNGAITLECAALTFGAAATGLAVAAVDLRRRTHSSSQLLLAAGMGALVCAAQAINVPVLPTSSAHLVGGVLLAWTLGPSLGLWTMAVILTLQALLIGDGGGMALGANILNMGLLPATLVAGYRYLVASKEVSPFGRYSSVGGLAAVAVPLAAGTIALETLAFRSGNELAGWSSFAWQLLAAHLWIGLGEGLLTVAIVGAYERFAQPATIGRPAWSPTVAMLAIGLALVAVALPFASDMPDSYEATAEVTGQTSLLAQDASELSSLGAWTVSVADFQNRLVAAIAGGVPNEQLLVAAAMLLTAGATLLVAYGLTRVPVPGRR
jgi:cobalt/nickel transport system permease protein